MALGEPVALGLERSALTCGGRALASRSAWSLRLSRVSRATSFCRSSAELFSSDSWLARSPICLLSESIALSRLDSTVERVNCATLKIDSRKISTIRSVVSAST